MFLLLIILLSCKFVPLSIHPLPNHGIRRADYMNTTSEPDPEMHEEKSVRVIAKVFLEKIDGD